MSAENIVNGTGTAAFSRRLDGTISAWNDVAELLMSTSSAEALGQKCHHVLAGRDVFGNDFCGKSCTCQRMAAAGQRIYPFRLTVTNSRGRTLMLRVSVLTADGPQGAELVHLLEPAMGSCAVEVLTNDFEQDQDQKGFGWTSLTRREIEVLHQLAQGRPTGEISKRLSISPTTVRNHISRCLHKLEAHTRLEAVGVARRLDIV